MPLPTPAPRDRGRRARVRDVELAEGDPIVVGDDELVIGLSVAHRRTSAGTVSRSASTEHLQQPRHVGLPARQHRELLRRSRTMRAAPCTATAWSCSAAGRPSTSMSAPSGATTTAATICPRSASSTPNTMASRTVGHIADDRLDFARRDVRTAGLDHVAASTLEVEEALVVDREEVAGAEPAVGR